ncbi:MAG: hypothetical protein AB7I32_12585 [Gammaproteobacteria bacterium]
MKLIVSTGLLLACALVAGVVAAEGVYDEKKGSSYNNAAPDELMRLPKYCWGHYEKRFKAPKFHISKQSCGPMMNHFCPGILRFNRSQNPMASKMERQSYLRQSLKNFDYTMNGMKEYPGCYIRKHVLIMQKRARLAATMAVR